MSRFAYVRGFEDAQRALPNTWLVVRVDGCGFRRFTQEHGFQKPNDGRGLALMNAAACATMREFGGAVAVAFGQSDEMSFVLRRGAALFGRRREKILSTLVSCFTAHYIFMWPAHFGTQPLRSAPHFDGRVVCYPSAQNVRDYLSWRQVDTHVNNLYNTCFWRLVQCGGMSPAEAHEALSGTTSAAKNELLFSRFGVNYNEEPAQFRKGSVIVRRAEPQAVVDSRTGEAASRSVAVLAVLHVDIVEDSPFWTDAQHAHILE